MNGVFDGSGPNSRRFFRDQYGQVWDVELMETEHIVRVTKLLYSHIAARPNERDVLVLPENEMVEAIKANDQLQWPLTMQILTFRRILGGRGEDEALEELNEYRRGL